MSTTFEPLVTAVWLHDHLDEVRVVDCTTHMTAQPVGASLITPGHADFAQGHIPGAQHVEMVDDLSDPDGPYPYTLPPAAQIERLLGGLGIRERDHIVLYTAAHPMTATRAWYVLRASGHERVSILDGGLSAWTSAGFPLETEVRRPVPVRYVARPDRARHASRDEVWAAASHPGHAVINALSPAQYAGTGGAHYGRPGRIPGSVNVPAGDLLNADGTFRSPAEIRRRFESAGVSAEQKVTTYCGGGIAATVDAFALALAGHDDWAVYDRSLLEWSADERNPMECD